MPKPHRKIYIFENTYKMSNYLLEAWVRWASESIAAHQRFTVALSGGRTPVEFYSKLSSLNRFDLWQKTFVFWADERFVPAEHPDSNYKLINDYLLTTVPIPEENIFPIPTNIDSAENAVLLYEGAIQEFFHLPVGGFPKFDVMLLGIGEDGHTASLFPNHPSLNETSRLTVSASPQSAPHDRMSLSLPTINHSRIVAFIAAGKNKASIVRSILKKEKECPAAQVIPNDGELLFFLDHEAAKLITINDECRHDGDALIIES